MFYIETIYIMEFSQNLELKFNFKADFVNLFAYSFVTTMHW